MENTITVEFKSGITKETIASGTYKTIRSMNRAKDRYDNRYGAYLTVVIVKGDRNLVPYK